MRSCPCYSDSASNQVHLPSTWLFAVRPEDSRAPKFMWPRVAMAHGSLITSPQPVWIIRLKPRRWRSLLGKGVLPAGHDRHDCGLLASEGRERADL